MWDRLHGTLRLNVAQQDLELGVPAYRSPQDVTLAKAPAMPPADLPEWKLPSGEAPARAEAAEPASALGARGERVTRFRRVDRPGDCRPANRFCSLRRAILRMYEPFQLFRPVEDDVDFRRSIALRERGLQHEKPLSVAGDVVIRMAESDLASVEAREQRPLLASAELRLGLDRDLHDAVSRAEKETASIRRP